VDERERAAEAGAPQDRLFTPGDQAEEKLRPANSRLEDTVRELRKKNEELTLALAAAREAAEIRSRFLAAMSHEIRTPMTGVLGMTELLLCTPLNPEQRHYAETIKESTESLLRIVNDILDLSKIEAGKLEIESVVFDLRVTLRAVTTILLPQAHAKGLRLITEVAEDVPAWLSGDPGRLRQVLVNIAGNAVKFTERGQVRLLAEMADCEGERASIRFRIEDTGIGIAPDQIEAIFEEFVQVDNSAARRFGGTGLGLSIAKRLVEMMGGQIGCSSRLGQGSVFWFTLPFRIAPAMPCGEARSGPEAPHGLSGQRPRVLVVEDNPVNRTIAVRLLAREGCQVDAVESGQEAIEACAATEYDLVLMDVNMPGVDGYEATRQIRRREAAGRHTPIVAITASAMKGDRDRCLECGMDDYVSKPFSADRLRELLQTWARPRPAR
jgi:signal transduction histidine kinase